MYNAEVRCEQLEAGGASCLTIFTQLEAEVQRSSVLEGEVQLDHSRIVEYIQQSSLPSDVVHLPSQHPSSQFELASKHTTWSSSEHDPLIATAPLCRDFSSFVE